jgi:pilus assembly protein CpaC
MLMQDGGERHYKITVADPNGPKRNGAAGAVEARDNIRLDFYFVQVSRNYGHQLGLGFPGSVAPSLSAAYDFKAGSLDSATAVIQSQALPRLDIAQASGWAKVMRQAAVVTANGEKASFSGGGEVNVPIQSALTSGVQQIPFGSVVEVEPVYDSRVGASSSGCMRTSRSWRVTAARVFLVASRLSSTPSSTWSSGSRSCSRG